MSEKAKRRLEFSLTAVFVLAVMLVAAVLIFSGGSATAKQIATLRIMGGQVEVAHDGDDAQAGEPGESLREGDVVHTGSDGRASIEYFDGSVTRLDFDTTFELIALETLNNDAGSKVIEGSQGDGNTYNRVAELTDAASRFDIETPTATASVQGTVYAVLVNDDGSTTIATIEGLVQALTNGGTVDVPAGKMVVVDLGGTAGPLTDIPDDLLDSDWIAFNQCDLDEEQDCVLPGVVEPEDPDEPKDEPKKNDEPGSFPQGSDGQPGGPPGDDVVPPPLGLNQQPHAGFTASPEVGAAPLTVHFTDGSSDPDGDALARSWSFGDGASQNAGLSPTHTYDEPGNYQVTLVVTDPDGASDSKQRTINVGTAADTDAPVVRITGRPANPTQSRNATFTFTSNEAGAGFVCTLDGETDPCGPGSSGAGTEDPAGANDVNGSASYSNLSLGPHSFSVSMTDASGNTGSDSFSWTIQPPPNQEPVFDHIVISPSNATIQLGGSQNYTAEAFDTDGASMGNVTGQTNFDIQPSGSCNGNTCTPTQSGVHAVIGTFSGDSDTAQLNVREPPPAEATRISLSSSGNVSCGSNGTLTARLLDANGNLVTNENDTVVTFADTSPGIAGEIELSGGASATASGGIATKGFTATKTGTVPVQATAPGLAADTTQFNVTGNCPEPSGDSGSDDVAVGLVILLPALGGLLRRRR